MFLQGCDASLLIASTPSNSAERDAVPNLTVRGFDIVDEIKAQAEAACPGIVSCADIIALASRDAVVQVTANLWSLEAQPSFHAVEYSSKVDVSCINKQNEHMHSCIEVNMMIDFDSVANTISLFFGHAARRAFLGSRAGEEGWHGLF